MELQVHFRHQIPRDIACQIRSYMRVQWPLFNIESDRLWDSPPQEDRWSFVIMNGELLVSHADVNQRELPLFGQTLRVYGLSAVFTYPAYRKSGYGAQVVRAASEHILESNGDVAMLFCASSLRPFYQRCGWTDMPTASVLKGDAHHPTVEADSLLMLFLSDTGRRLMSSFQSQPFYVGTRTW